MEGLDAIGALIKNVGFPMATGMLGLLFMYRDRIDARAKEERLQAENKDLQKLVVDVMGKMTEANFKNAEALRELRDAVRK